MHSKGKVDTPCELEQVMRNESKELIENLYDNKAGKDELEMVLNQSKNEENIKLLDLTRIDERIRLKDMSRSWMFTRTVPL